MTWSHSAGRVQAPHGRDNTVVLVFSASHTQHSAQKLPNGGGSWTPCLPRSQSLLSAPLQGLPAHKATQSVMTRLRSLNGRLVWGLFQKQKMDIRLVLCHRLQGVSTAEGVKWDRKLDHDLEGSRRTWKSVIINLIWTPGLLWCLRACWGGMSVSCDKMGEITTLQLPQWRYYGNQVTCLSQPVTNRNWMGKAWLCKEKSKIG